jgi:hypothetical protein
MLFGFRARTRKHRTVRLHLGALFALLVQTALPMPAMAETMSPFDGASICHTGDPIQQTAPRPDKSPSHTSRHCPVCQAIQLLGSLTPPAPIALPRRYVGAETADFVSHAAIRPHHAAAAHQARAPPPSV